MAKKTKKILHDHIAEGLRTLAVEVSTLRQDPSNARLHNDQNVEAIMSSLSKFGQRKPVVVNKRDGIVEAGNGTLQAARSLGWSHVAAVFVDDDPATATGFAIADNRTAELATWDEETLGRLLESIGDEMPAIELGFSDEQLAEIMAPLNEDPIGEDIEPTEPPEKPVSQRGEVFELGPHRLMCGDSTSKDDVDALLCGEKIDLLLSDPPYGVSYVGKTSDALKVENDDLDEDSLRELIQSAFGIAEINSRPGAYWYATVPAGPLHLIFAQDWKDRGILRQIMVWAKDSMVLGHSEYHYKHEPILFGWVPGKRHKNSDRTRTTVWECPRPKASREHPTMKPLELWERAIVDGSIQGESVYDPFLGSGTTLIAAARQGRKCYGMEISPAYCDVIRKRWTAYAKENGLEAGSGAL
jgi:DNA modification methylase